MTKFITIVYENHTAEEIALATAHLSPVQSMSITVEDGIKIKYDLSELVHLFPYRDECNAKIATEPNRNPLPYIINRACSLIAKATRRGSGNLILMNTKTMDKNFNILLIMQQKFFTTRIYEINDAIPDNHFLALYTGTRSRSNVKDCGFFEDGEYIWLNKNFVDYGLLVEID